jgi:hypothetical protein
MRLFEAIIDANHRAVAGGWFFEQFVVSYGKA